MRNAGTDITAPSTAALRIGEQAGLPLHRFDLDDAVEGAAVGKVLITVCD